MLDVEGLLGDLERMLNDFLAIAESRTGSVRSSIQIGDDVKVSSTLRVGFLDELPPTYPVGAGPEREPLIDVIKTKEGFRVLVELPGVSKEDVKVLVRERFLRFEIHTRGKMYEREVRCPVAPDGVQVKSVVENNSIVELTFARRRSAIH